MIFAYWDFILTQEKISRKLKLRPGLGVPASNITFLRSEQIRVAYFVGSSVDNIFQWLQDGIPIIAFVQAGELPHWRDVQAQHAVIIVGLEDQTVFIHDPGLGYGPIEVALGDFLLAWEGMDHRCAVMVYKQE